MALPLEKITADKKVQIKTLINRGYDDWKILETVFDDKNGHHTITYLNIIRRIRKTV